MSTKPVTLDDAINFRCIRSEKKKFNEHCEQKLKRPAREVLREIIVALPEGRVSIQPTDEQKQATEELYK